MVVVGDIIRLNSNEYAVLATDYVDGKYFVFTNKLSHDEKGTQDFFIFEVDGNDVIIVDESEKMNRLLPKFKEDVKDLIEKKLVQEV